MTLVECLLALVILMVAVLAVTCTINSGHQHQEYADRALRAVRLGEHLLEEIQTRPYAGSQAAGGRSAYHIDDFDGFLEPPGGLADSSGTLYLERDQRFTRTATVTPANVAIVGIGARDGKMILVTLQSDQGEAWALSRFICEESP
jgi:hypothetical protein